MIDTEQFEGHTEGPWKVGMHNGKYCIRRKGYMVADSIKQEDADFLAAAPDLLAEVKRLQKRLASINYTVREIIDSCRRMEPHDINNCDVCTWQEELATIEDETMGVLD